MTTKGPAVLAAGIPAHHSIVPAQQQEFLGKLLKDEEAKMHASGYDFEILYVMPEEGISEFKKKLREKEWKVVLIGRGLRQIDSMISVFEAMVNAVREECPGAKLAFNGSVDGMLEAFERVLPLK